MLELAEQGLWQPEIELAEGPRRTGKWLATKLGRPQPVARTTTGSR